MRFLSCVAFHGFKMTEKGQSWEQAAMGEQVKLEVEHTTKPLRLTGKCAACKNGPPLAPCVRTSYPEVLDTRSRVKLSLLTLDKVQFFIIVYLQHQL
jgi:hypothetical protein